MPYRRRAQTRRAPVRSRRSRLTRRKPARKVRTRKHKAPVSTGYATSGGGIKSQMKMTQISDTCLRIQGRSYLGAVSNSDRGVNSIGLLADINPALLGDRISVLASTYDKYCYQTVTFTYIPQCPTSQPGSVMLAFERDPENPLANVASNSFMQEVMSYEHAKLTPAWVSTSVTYKRDPHEKKTWFLGGDQANMDARVSSQGNFIAYTSNATIGNLGFVVMDYVLDLVSPNIIPIRIGPELPTQWTRANNTAFTSNAGAQLYSTPYAGMASGSIYEYVIDQAATNFYQVANVGISTAVNNQTLVPGQRLYAVYVEGVSGPTSTAQSAVLLFTSLAPAYAAASSGMNSTANSSNAAGFFDNFGSAIIGQGSGPFMNGSCWQRALVTRTNTTL